MNRPPTTTASGTSVLGRAACATAILAFSTNGFAQEFAPAAGVDAEKPATPATPVAPTAPTPVPVAPTAAPSPALASAPLPEASVQPPVADRSVTRWRQRFAEVRGWLAEGSFDRAGPELQRLARTAPTPAEERAASELAQLATHWTTEGRVLVDAETMGESVAGARGSDTRTADELVVLYVTAGLYGLGSGVALVPFTDPSSAGGVFLPMLALGGASLGAVAVADSGRPLRYGVPAGVTSGLYFGFEQGLTWVLMNAEADYRDQWDDKTISMVLWGSTTLGGIAGGLIADQSGSTPGQASYVGSLALWSSLATGLIAGAASEDTQTPFLAAALGLNGGAFVGLLTADDVQPKISRVRFLDLGAGGGAIVGALGYFSLADTSGSFDGLLISTALGTAAGFGLAWGLTNDMSPDRRLDQRKDPSEFAIRGALMPSRDGVNGVLYGTF